MTIAYHVDARRHSRISGTSVSSLHNVPLPKRGFTDTFYVLVFTGHVVDPVQLFLFTLDVLHALGVTRTPTQFCDVGLFRLSRGTCMEQGLLNAPHSRATFIRISTLDITVKAE